MEETPACIIGIIEAPYESCMSFTLNVKLNMEA